MNRDKAERLLAGMTPPDSGDERLRKGGWRSYVLDEPDSGEREVPNHTVCIGWPTIRRVAAEGGVYFADSDVALVAADDLFHSDAVPVPLPLAQRILAALESLPFEQLESLADELRAAVERKT